MDGWIKLHRRIEKHWIWSNPLFVKAWVYCLFRANYDDNKVLLGNKVYKVERGTFYTSIGNFGKATGLSTQQTRDFWKLLEDDEMITRKGTRKGTKISVCNYVDYQVLQQDNNKITTRSQQDHNKGKEYKEEKEGKENPPISPQGDSLEKEYFPVPDELNTEMFRAVWFDEWIPYRKEQRYKNPGYQPKGLKGALTGLKNISNGNPNTAIKIIRQSIAQNYQGLFPLKQNSNSKRKGAAKPEGHYDNIKTREIQL